MFSRLFPRRGSRRGFTLVELLVVIGIIALLISILLPSLRKARKAARVTACLSNCRQLGMAMQMYIQESKGKFSPYFKKPQIEWMNQMVKANQFDAVRLCPEAQEPNERFRGSGNMPGGAFMCWGPEGAAVLNPFTGERKTGSYGMNGYLYRYGGTGGDDATLIAASQAGKQSRLWVLPLRQSSEVPFVYDSTWDNAWPKETELPPNSLYDPAGGPPMNISNNWSRLCVARHNMALNICYMDGHAATVSLPDLWRQKWHKEWDVSLVNFDTVTSQIRSRYKG